MNPLRCLKAVPAGGRELAELERRLRAEMRHELDAQLLEHKRHVNGELDALTERIDDVLHRAVRALNDPRGTDPS